MADLEQRLADLQKQDATAQSSVGNCKDGIKTEEKKKKELNKNKDDVSLHDLTVGLGLA